MTTTLTIGEHAMDRVAERLTAAERTAVIERIQRVAAALPDADTALRIMRLAAGQRNDAWSDASNGDTVWAIIRGGRVTTVMLRRSTQPTTPAAFDVATVLFYRETGANR